MKRMFFLMMLMIISLTICANHYVVTSYNVLSDSTRLQTLALQKVIDKAEREGGGTIVIPKGVFLTGALFFKPGTKLELNEGAVLKGSDNIADYPLVPSRMEGKRLDYYAALINAYNVDGFSIKGPGTINGNGSRFWSTFWAYRDSVKKLGRSATNLEVHRPRLLFIWGCRNVTLRNVRLWNSGFWTTHLYQCMNVRIIGCDIRSPFKPVPAPSTDGVDIDVCKGVLIRNCYISVNDDAVCIKGGKGPLAHRMQENGIVEDVLVERCTFGPSHGTLTLGSECIHARNITLRNCTMDNDCPVLRLKMRPDTYQTYEKIRISKVKGRCGNIIEMAPWKQFYTLEGTNEKPRADVRDIRFSDLDLRCKQFGQMEGNPSDSVSKVTFSQIKALVQKEGFKNNYAGVRMDKVQIRLADPDSPADQPKK